jgi:UDPglucose 6-dehydrogenase
VPIGSGNWVGALVRDAFAGANGHNPSDRFAVASNPEFLREGVALHDTFYPDRIVIGSAGARALDVLTNLYRPILNQDFTAPEFLPRPEGLSAVPMVTTDLASAELIKYAANAFLALKISYINEIAQLSEKVGADITQIAKGIGLDTRIGSRFLEAGIGWGGSCFGKDTSALITTAADYRLDMPIVKAARKVNYNQREWIVEKLLNELKILKGRTVTLLGLAFKPNTDDLRDAPALDIAARLIQRGAKVKAHDPIALESARRYYGDIGIHYYDDPVEAALESDAIVLVTQWSDYRKLNWGMIREQVRLPLILDGRNFLPEEQLEGLGFTFIGVGRGTVKGKLHQAVLANP